MNLLYALEPIYSKLPAIKAPAGEVPITKRIMWSSIVLILFFIMGEITVVGLSTAAEAQLKQYQILLASKMGSIITLGIGPIVMASIFLQLLMGAGLFTIDRNNPKDRARFQGLQKLLAILLCFIEGVMYMSGFLVPMEGMWLAVLIQVALGGIILIYLDEIVNKYGVGSGVGLFIAGGVSASFFWQVFRPPIETAIERIEPGLIFSFINSLSTGADFTLFLPLIMAIIIYLLIILAEGIHVNIPLAIGVRGIGGRYPIKLLYVSNMPIILAVALFANFQLWANFAAHIPILGQILGTLAWATHSPRGLFIDIIRVVASEGITALFVDPLASSILQGISYTIILTIASVVFGIFWVDMSGQGSEAIANQLMSSGMHIPGFRKDPRIIKSILDRYIPTITILGSIFVALLAAVGNMALGTLTSGIGILLTVGIVYRLYEQLAKEQILQSHPLLGKIFK